MEQRMSPLKTTALFFVVIIGIGISFYFLRLLQSILIPFVTAYFLFFVFQPLNNKLQKLRIPLWGAIIADILIMFFVISVLSSFIVGAFSSFSGNLPEYQDKLSRSIAKIAVSLGINDPALRNFQFKDLADQVDLKTAAGSAFTSTFSFLGSLLIMFVLFAFIASGHPMIYKALNKRFSRDNANENSDDKKKQERGYNPKVKTSSKVTFNRTFNEIEDQVRKYFISKVIISLITAVSEGLVLFLFGVDFAIIWAVIIFFLNFIPNVGSLIGIALPSLIAVVEFDSLLTVVIMVAVLFVLDTILGYIVEPLMFGDTMKMNPLVIIIGLLAWSYLWGIMGALLAVPMMSVFRIIISKSDSPNLILIDDLMRDK